MLGHLVLGAAKWWPVSVGSHTTLLCVPGVPSGQFMTTNITACQDSCLGAATCNGVNYLDGHGEGPSYCFLKNCTYPEFPPAITNGIFDHAQFLISIPKEGDASTVAPAGLPVAQLGSHNGFS